MASVSQRFDYYKYHLYHGEQDVYWNPTYNENGIPLKEEGIATNLTTGFAINWLDEWDDSKPFCLLLQYKASHREWSSDRKYKSLFKDQTIPLPDSFNGYYKGRE